MRPAEVRAACRRGEFRGGTSGRCPGFAQANLIALPGPLAGDFRRFCERNPRPCPLLAVSEGPAGAAALEAVAAGADLRTDLPRYRVWRGGEEPFETETAAADWPEDFAAFLLGCSFGFEAALVAAGIRLRHQDEGRVVPMYVTSRECEPAGPFRGPLVVSMRPIPEARVGEAAALSARFPLAHGAPVHAGDPASLGIGDLSRPDFGEDGGLRPGEVPVFWACGVTSQLAARNAAPERMIAHAPGHMFVTDLPVGGPAAAAPAAAPFPGAGGAGRNDPRPRSAGSAAAPPPAPRPGSAP